jgi:anti-sigma B factor antagonist
VNADPVLKIVTERDGDIIVLRLRGDVDMAAEEVLSAALRVPLPAGVHELVVDLADAPFIDSTGVRVLLEGRDRALAHGAVLTVRNAQPLVLHVLQLTGVAGLFGT